MRLIRSNLLASAALAAALLLPVASWAQTTATSTTTAEPAAASSTAREQRVEQHIADMHATLHITQAQEKQWNDFAQVMLDNAQAMDALMAKRADPTAQSAEQILADYAEITQQHAQNVQKLATAFHTLYAGLAADQKKAADQMFRSTAEQREQKAMQKQGG
jgi:septal ring factor EnvC (AmiA/AmiB activator)